MKLLIAVFVSALLRAEATKGYEVLFKDEKDIDGLSRRELHNVTANDNHSYSKRGLYDIVCKDDENGVKGKPCDYYRRNFKKYCPNSWYGFNKELKEKCPWSCGWCARLCRGDNGGCSQKCETYANGVYKIPATIRCSCKEGFKLNPDGKTCANIGSCNKDNGGCSQVCSSGDSKIFCSCNKGYKLNKDGYSCHKVGPCDTNNGGCSQICKSEGSKVVCSCESQYKLSQDGKSCTKQCEDDEYGWLGIPCIAFRQNQCRQYFNVKKAKIHCPKHCGYCDDHCATNNGGCSQGCEAPINSKKPKCTCRDGFLLEKDGKTCRKVGPCDTNNGGCSQICKSEGSKVVCSCESQYKLNKDGKSCDKQCKDAEEGYQGESCDYWFEGHNCGKHRYSAALKKYCPRTCGFCVDHCRTDNGGCSHSCNSPFDSKKAICSCKDGYHLNKDGKTCEKASNMCPDDHPYAYFKGGYCCLFNKEGINPQFGASCDGSELTSDSMCCKDNKFVACPHGKCATNTATDKAASNMCPSDHPFSYFKGAFCCLFNKEAINPQFGADCDGSELSSASMCCKNNKFVACPNGKCTTNTAPAIDTTASNMCPSHHPFSYFKGGFCCMFNKEAINPQFGASCDGSELSAASMCCKDNKFVKCPHEKCATNTAPAIDTTDSCLVDGIIYKKGKKFVDDRCSGRCECKGNNVVKCLSLCPSWKVQCGNDEKAVTTQVPTVNPKCLCKREKCVKKSTGNCPKTHPYAYLGGGYCCSVNKEKVAAVDGARCDGSTISLSSSCCAGGAVRCPDGKCGSHIEDGCSVPVEKVGCFHASSVPTRTYSKYLLDRNAIRWGKQYAETLNKQGCKCAELAGEAGYTYFALTNFGECWSGPSMNFARDGASKECVGGDFKECDDDGTTACSGKANNDYIYRIIGM